MIARRLSREHEPALRRLLQADPIQNLFPLAQLEPRTLERGFWYGAWEDTQLKGTCFYPGERLLVPWAPDPLAAEALAGALPAPQGPTMLVGPRLAVDHLWRRWAQGHLPDRYYDQRLYVCENAASETPDPDFRLAQPEEAEEIAKRAGQMEWEDLGRNPADENAEAHLRAVQERIFQGRLWVLVREGELVFQINVGSSHARGVQVGGTYVPPRFRGQGLAAHGMRQLCRELLQTHRFVTLHVNEANPSAVRTYENSSFKRYSPFRLIMATWPTETP